MQVTITKRGANQQVKKIQRLAAEKGVDIPISLAREMYAVGLFKRDWNTLHGILEQEDAAGKPGKGVSAAKAVALSKAEASSLKGQYCEAAWNCLKLFSCSGQSASVLTVSIDAAGEEVIFSFQAPDLAEKSEGYVERLSFNGKEYPYFINFLQKHGVERTPEVVGWGARYVHALNSFYLIHESTPDTYELRCQDAFNAVEPLVSIMLTAEQCEKLLALLKKGYAVRPSAPSASSAATATAQAASREVIVHVEQVSDKLSGDDEETQPQGLYSIQVPSDVDPEIAAAIALDALAVNEDYAIDYPEDFDIYVTIDGEVVVEAEDVDTYAYDHLAIGSITKISDEP